MKKFLLSLAIMMFAVTAVNAQETVAKAPQVKKECCKDKKMEGKKCDKPADQQCPDCKAKAAECKDAKKECKMAEGQKCDKQASMKKDCCKDKKMAEGKKCDKPADQQCPDCKEKAKKN